ALVVTSFIPNTYPLGAMFDGSVNIHVLQMHLLVANNYVYIILTSQTVISDRQERIDVGRHVDASHGSTLVHYDINETGILVGKAVMILAPHGRSDQQVQGRDFFTPGQLVTN